LAFNTAIAPTGFRPLARLGSAALALTCLLGVGLAEPRHGIAMHGEPALPPDFQHLPYANPDAPRGGRIAYGNLGTFDSLNPFIVKGAAPRGLWDPVWGNNVWESLLDRNWDEPFSLYGLLAETVETPDDRSFVEFTLRPEARFADGEPVKTEDVIFSFQLLKEKGRPRGWHGKVASVEKVGERGVRFTFTDASDRELPLIAGLMPVFPKHAVDPQVFAATSFKPMLGSGPYEVAEVVPGTSVTLKRRADYWGKDLPLKRGVDNFDTIRLEYFRDAGAHFEAFKKGLFDVNFEGEPGRWATGYEFPAKAKGDVVLETIESGTPAGMNGFVLNTRREVFKDPRVREALTYFLDFEWLNKNLYHGLYERTGSYFEGSELSALGRPASEGERALLAPYPNAARADVMGGTYRPPESDESGRDRQNLRKGLQLLTDAGYARQGGKLVHAASGRPLTFEVVVRTKEDERLALAFQRTLALVGIDVSIRQVDDAQYWNRLTDYNYDVIRWHYGSSLSPGNEQIGRWSSQAARTPGTWNYAGVENPAADAMIDALLSARERGEFEDAVRAFDRVLISGFYAVPLFYSPGQWVARWKRIQHPEKSSVRGAEPTTWWATQ
jgi:peptide/nickel transport system substrate-binding protein